MPVGIGTGAWIAPGGRGRHRHINAWSVVPDYCSVSLNEQDAVEVIGLLHARGIGIEVRKAARLGCATKVGFDDARYLPDGALAEDNAALVREAVAILKMQASAARRRARAERRSLGGGVADTAQRRVRSTRLRDRRKRVSARASLRGDRLFSASGSQAAAHAFAERRDWRP
jgi:hypothetical protein